MIKNIPDPKDFYHASLQYLNISWSMAFEVYKISVNVLGDEDADDYREDQKYHLNTCLMLLSQSIELFLKFRICEVNPLLIVHLKGAGVGEDYGDLQTIDAKDLILLHDQVRSDALGSKLTNSFEEIRKKRNKIMHSTGSELHEEESILIQIIRLSKLLYGKPWLELRTEALDKTYFSDSYTYTYNAIEEFTTCKENLDTGIFKIYSGNVPKDFHIFCEYCNHHMDYSLEEYTCINKDPSTYVCLICSEGGSLSDEVCDTCTKKCLDETSGTCLHCILVE